MSFVVTIKQLAPSWLLGKTGTKLLNTFGRMFDSLRDTLKDGVKASMPDYAPEDALGYIGNDLNLERGPSESAAGFRVRIRGGVDSNRNRGGARTLLSQLAAFFADSGYQPPLRLVSNSAIWHVYDWVSGLTSKYVVRNNWNWDDHPERHWRGWVIIDSSAGPWAPIICGDPSGGVLDDGATCGSTATAQQVQAVQRIVQRWKPAGVYVVRIIVAFDSGMFQPSSPRLRGRGPWIGPRFHFLARNPNPDGGYDDPARRDPRAAYWLGGGEEP